MNKRVIWLIIGVMSMAVIGVVALQTDLILTSIRANEDAFDKNVQNALSAVAERIEKTATSKDAMLVINGYSVDYVPSEAVVGLGGDGNGGMSIPVTGITSYDLVNVYSPLEERIDAAILAQVLKQELQNHAIKTNYEFGVFSEDRQAFIIHDGYYVADNVQPRTQPQPGYSNLSLTDYSVTLFENDQGEAAGKLKIFFPEKSRVMWSALLPSFLGTFLFAALILACFGYTVWVIFHQKRLSEMKTDFINNMTHEFKTPIATISLAADSITNPRISGDISKVERFANIIKQENKRMNSQVEKVLQMAQNDREESKLRLAEVDLHDVISRAVENIGLQVEPRQGTATVVLRATNPIVQGDLTHISNVVNNLLDNANKYSPNVPHITVTTSDLKDGVQVVVSDEGMGMSKEARKHIFDKFYRVHTGDLHDVKGFGLGLSYVKAIMDAHRGTVEVRSELDKGSDFVLSFPRRQDDGRLVMT